MKTIETFFYIRTMSFVLFDDPEIRFSLMPFTFTRPVSEIRVGIFTITEKWKRYLKEDLFFKTQPYLHGKFLAPASTSKPSIYINGAVCPNPDLYEAVINLRKDQVLVKNETVLAYYGEDASEEIKFKEEVCVIRHCWDIFKKNGEQIKHDIQLVQANKTTSPVNDKHTVVYNPENVFIEPGVKIRAAVLNAEHGPIYLGRNSEVQEGAVIRGPFALCEGAVVNMGCKVRGDSTVGPFSKVGGEISNSVIFGYSNKGHDGFIGNTVIGEWCNLGADTNISNLKNNYSSISIYNFKKHKPTDTGLQFCGLMMGDHSKTSINSMLNTGTVVGVFANIFGHGFPPKYVPSFSWGGSEGFEEFKLEKAYEVAERVMKRRGIEFSDEDQKILNHIFNNCRNI